MILTFVTLSTCMIALGWTNGIADALEPTHPIASATNVNFFNLMSSSITDLTFA
jgi:hypothetical protein